MQAASEIRSSFLDFFVENGHLRTPSASLVPDDPSLLLTVAGMVPFKPIFLGLKPPPDPPRATSAQRCLRTNDLEDVGATSRHHTFFEMLGNFSFGDYFKDQAIEYAWTFVTEQMGLKRKDLWVTIYPTDEEARSLWRRHVDEGRIVELEDNFWAAGPTGPCGPDSEIHIDRGQSFAPPGHDCPGPGCECDRFEELWNLVFMQYDRDESGQLTPLERTGIDTGAGLERMAKVLQQGRTNFDTDIFRPLIHTAQKATGSSYDDDASKRPLRVVADHARAVTFLALDGVRPGYTGREYVMRRLIRRGARFWRQLGGEPGGFSDLVLAMPEAMPWYTPELAEAGIKKIRQHVRREEMGFGRTLEGGLRAFERVVEEHPGGLPGDVVFRLYDTFGFPIEMTEELAQERGLAIDRVGFEARLAEQVARSRAGRFVPSELGDERNFLSLPASNFIGYDQMESESIVLWEDDGEAVIDPNPFYAEGGGQVGDQGTLVLPAGEVRRVVDTVHRGAASVLRLEAGPALKPGDRVKASVDAGRRIATARNHTATHLLHAALRRALEAPSAIQAGSLVAPDRFTFDFVTEQPLEAGTLQVVVSQVNATIREDLEVSTEETTPDAARAAGAMALFGEKYGEVVRLVRVGDISAELCGGTHVRHTGQIGAAVLVSEGSVGAGVRRVEVRTGEGADEFLRQRLSALEEVSRQLKAPPEQLPARLEQMQKNLREAEHELERLRRRVHELEAGGAAPQAGIAIEQAGKWKLVHRVVDDVASVEELREIADVLEERNRPAAVLVASGKPSLPLLVTKISEPYRAAGLDAAELARAAGGAIGGKGGGRPTFGQAGGIDTAQYPAAVNAAIDWLKGKS